jgi:hypothetical protein
MIHQQLWWYKIEEKLHVGVREEKKLNTSSLVDGNIAPSNIMFEI